MRQYRDYKAVFAGIPKPFAYVDLDLLAENIRQIAARAGGKRIRIASKSLRCVDLMKRIMDADNIFQGVMCYSALEALYLADRGFDDLLIGYPVCEPEQLARIGRHVKAGKRITLMVDSAAHVELIEAAAEREGVRIPVCIDIDMSLDVPGLHFGVWRSPLRSREAVAGLMRLIAASKQVRLDGIMGYEAQIAGVGDRMPGQRLKNTVVRWLKRRSAREVRERRAHAVQLAGELGQKLRFVNGGGTGSLHTTALEPAVTEVTAGSGFYAPGLFDYYRDFRFQPAAGYAVEIVRRPRYDLYTCAGGGYIASGAAGREKLPAPYLPAGAELLPLEGAGEVQTPVRYRGDEPLELGDPIFMRHAKAGELCERFDRLLLVSQGRIAGEARTYRGDGQCFL